MLALPLLAAVLAVTAKEASRRFFLRLSPAGIGVQLHKFDAAFPIRREVFTGGYAASRTHPEEGGDYLRHGQLLHHGDFCVR